MRVNPSFFILLFLLLGSGLFIFGFYNKKPVSTVASNHTITSVKGTSTDSGDVETVIDGDTITLTSGKKVRLIGINAPEDGQPGYLPAKETLTSLVDGKNIDIEYDTNKTDQYGRDLAYVYVGDTLVNLELVKEGVVVIDTVPPNVAHANDFLAGQIDARKNCKGMWEGLCHQSASSCIQIASINASPTGSDSASMNSEWISFMNTCKTSEDLKGYLLKDTSSGNSYVFKETVVKSRQKVTLHTGCGVDTARDLYWQCPERAMPIWNNDSDSAYLYDAQGRLVSQMSY